MTLFLLFLILIAPSYYGGNAQLLKLFITAVAIGISYNPKTVITEKRIPIYLGVAVLAIGLFSTLPQTIWEPGFFGGVDRVEGLVSMFCVFVFGWCVFWDRPVVKSRLLPSHYAIFLLFFLWFLDISYCLGGWNFLSKFIAGKLGVGLMLAQIIPIVIAEAFFIEHHHEYRIWSFFGCLFGIYVLVASGCRSALLGMIIGCSVMVLMYYKGKKLPIKPYAILLILAMIIMLSVLLHREARMRLESLNPGNFGRGVRTELARQWWEHGTPALGYGLEQQKYIIKHKEGFEMAIYDRFHNWIFDVSCSVGWIGLGCVLFGLFFVGRRAIENRHSYYHCAFTGSLVAFWAAGFFNPSSFQNMLLATISASGLYWRQVGTDGEWGNKEKILLSCFYVIAIMIAFMTFYMVKADYRLVQYAKTFIEYQWQ